MEDVKVIISIKEYNSFKAIEKELKEKINREIPILEADFKDCWMMAQNNGHGQSFYQWFRTFLEDKGKREFYRLKSEYGDEIRD